MCEFPTFTLISDTFPGWRSPLIIKSELQGSCGFECCLFYHDKFWCVVVWSDFPKSRFVQLPENQLSSSPALPINSKFTWLYLKKYFLYIFKFSIFMSDLNPCWKYLLWGPSFKVPIWIQFHNYDCDCYIWCCFFYQIAAIKPWEVFYTYGVSYQDRHGKGTG